jgi:hypothetical protein
MLRKLEMILIACMFFDVAGAAFAGATEPTVAALAATKPNTKAHVMTTAGQAMPVEAHVGAVALSVGALSVAALANPAVGALAIAAVASRQPSPYVQAKAPSDNPN